MVRVISALVTTLVAAATLGASSTPAAAPADSSRTVVLAGNHWCC